MSSAQPGMADAMMTRRVVEQDGDRLAQIHVKLIGLLSEAAVRLNASVPDLSDVVKLLSDLQMDRDRSELAARIATALIPSQPDYSIWLRRLSGSAAPPEFFLPRFRRGPASSGAVPPMSRSIGTYVSRSNAMLEKAAALEAQAKENLREAERIRREVDDCGLFARSFVVVSLLAKMVEANQARFAVGPAWVVLEAIHESPARDMIHARLRSLAGDAAFRFRLAQAVAEVCDEFADAAADADAERRAVRASGASEDPDFGEDNHVIAMIRARLGTGTGGVPGEDPDSASVPA